MSAPFAKQPSGTLPRLPINRKIRNRLRHRDRKRFQALERAARQLMLDPMEQRILLNADVLALDMSTGDTADQDHDLLVRLVEESEQIGDNTVAVQRVQVLDRAGGGVLAFGDLSELSGVSITGGLGSEKLTFDATSLAPATMLSFSFDGGEGEDSILFDSDSDVFWHIQALDLGNARDGMVELSFSGVENLTGAADNQDEFTVAGDGGVSGLIDGGDGGFDTLVLEEGDFDTLTYQTIDATSGVLLRDDQRLEFTGLEPVEVMGAADIVVDITSGAPGNSTSPGDAVSAGLRTGGLGMEVFSNSGGFESISFLDTVNSVSIASSDVVADLAIESFSSAFTGDLSVTVESLTLNSGVSLGTAGNEIGNVSLLAERIVTGSGLNLTDIGGLPDLTGTVTIDGSIFSSGTVTVGSYVELDVDASDSASLSNTAAPVLTSSAVISGSAVIEAASLDLSAQTVLDLDIDLTDTVVSGLIQAVTAQNSTTAQIADGATVAVSATTDAISVSASDSTGIDLELTPSAPGLLDSFTVAGATVDVTRTTLAKVGAVANLGGANTPEVSIAAINSGSITNKVISSLVGVATVSATDNVSAELNGASLQMGSLDVTATNMSNYTSEAKVATSDVSGATTAQILNTTTVASGSVGAVNVLAQDMSTIYAISSDVQVNIAASYFPAAGFSLPGLASAINEVDKDVLAQIASDGGTMTLADAASISVSAQNSQVLASETGVLVANDLSSPNTPIPGALTIAFGGSLASNELLGDTTARIDSATLSAAGDISVLATNSAVMDSNTAAMATTSGGSGFATSIAVAFNFLGVDVTNIGGLLLDTLIGTDLGDRSDPASATAVITSSAVSAAGLLAVRAKNEVLFDATVSNASDTRGIGGATGTFLLGGAQSLGFATALSANKIASEAVAEIIDSPSSTSVSGGTGVTVEADDQSQVFSNALVASTSVTTNDGGAALVDEAIGVFANADFRTDGVSAFDGSGAALANPTVDVNFGDRIGLTTNYVSNGTGDGAPTTIYRYLGDTDGGSASINLLDEDFTNLDLWQAVPETEFFPQGNNLTVGGSDSLAIGALLVRNELFADSTARISNATVTSATGDVTVKATEAAAMTATTDIGIESSGGSTLNGDGTSLAVGGVVAINTANASALAEIAGGADVTSTTGKVEVAAINQTKLTALLHGAISSGADAVGVYVAFNTLGYEQVDLGTATLDALVGTDFGAQTPSNTVARITDSNVAGATGVSVTALNSAELDAQIDNDASSSAAAFQGASAMSANGALASNMISGEAQAYIDETDALASNEAVTSSAGSVG
ncbi:MAG: LEPR-XLL domain-containing protein, partial [Pseudomonadota bacterium]